MKKAQPGVDVNARMYYHGMNKPTDRAECFVIIRRGLWQSMVY